MNEQNQSQIRESDMKLEERIKCAFKIIYHLFPKKKKGVKEAYNKLENETKGSSGLVGYNSIRLEYDESDFEKPPEIMGFSDAFIGYYQIVTGEEPVIIKRTNKNTEWIDTSKKENLGKETRLTISAKIDQNRVRIEIPNKNTRIIGYLDANNQFMYFRYRTDDADSQKMIDAYTEHLMNE